MAKKLTNRESVEAAGATCGALFICEKNPAIWEMMGYYWQNRLAFHRAFACGLDKESLGRAAAIQFAVVAIIKAGEYDNGSNTEELFRDISKLTRPCAKEYQSLPA